VRRWFLAAALLAAYQVLGPEPVQLPAASTTVTQRATLLLESFVEGTGPPLVMLGGGTLGAAEFAPHAHVLASRFRVVRLQTLNIARAQERQPLPSAYSIKIESAAMTESLDRLRLASVDVVGHSFGALVALDFALDHPERVRSLVLAEPPAFWVVPPDERRSRTDLRTMDALSETLGPATAPTDAQLVQFQCALGNCGVAVPAASSPEWNDWVFRRSALRGLSVVSSHSDDVKRLRDFRAPVLIVTGASTVAFHRRINDLLASYFPRVERAELPGGHGATSTARDEFIRVIDAFLARQASR